MGRHGYDEQVQRARFRDLYDEHFNAVLGYALRRASADDAADVAAETFTVAWRRLGDVPEPPATRPWLYGVARRTLANVRRGNRRRLALADVLRAELSEAVPDHSAEVVARVDIVNGLAGLSAEDAEILRLSSWEGLEPREIAEVLGMSPTVARKRLSRARSRLRARQGHDPTSPGHVPGERTRLASEEC